MPERARNESGQYVALAEGSQGEAPIVAAAEAKPRGPVVGSSGTDKVLNEKRAANEKKQDDVLARIFASDEFKDKTPVEREEAAAAEAKEQSEAEAAQAAAEEAQKPVSTPDRKRAEKAVELLGLKSSVIEKMSDGELFELAAHRTKVDNEVSQKLARLSEYEKKQQTAVAKGTQPGSEEPAGQGLNIAEAAKPLLEALVLDESALPAVEKFAKSILSAHDARFAALEASIRQTSDSMVSDTADITRSQLVNRFPELQKDEVWSRVEERMGVLASTGFYSDPAQSMRGRLERLMVDACKLESLDESKAKAEVDRVALSKAKANGDVSAASTTRTTKGMKPSDAAYQNALRAIEKFG